MRSNLSLFISYNYYFSTFGCVWYFPKERKKKKKKKKENDRNDERVHT